MIHHTCRSCQRGFIATSRDEAVEEAEKLKEGNPDYADCELEEMVDENLVGYARYCPYCMSTDVEAR